MKFCTAHDNGDTAACCAKFPNDTTARLYVMVGWHFVKFDFKIWILGDFSVLEPSLVAGFGRLERWRPIYRWQTSACNILSLSGDLTYRVLNKMVDILWIQFSNTFLLGGDLFILIQISPKFVHKGTIVKSIAWRRINTEVPYGVIGPQWVKMPVILGIVGSGIMALIRPHPIPILKRTHCRFDTVL